MILSDKISMSCIVILASVCLLLCVSLERRLGDIRRLNSQVGICEERLRSERNYSEMIFRAFQKSNEKLMTCETK